MDIDGEQQQQQEKEKEEGACISADENLYLPSVEDVLAGRQTISQQACAEPANAPSNLTSSQLAAQMRPRVEISVNVPQRSTTLLAQLSSLRLSEAADRAVVNDEREDRQTAADPEVVVSDINVMARDESRSGGEQPQRHDSAAMTEESRTGARVYSLRQRKAISLFPYTLNTWTRPDTLANTGSAVDLSVLYEPLDPDHARWLINEEEPGYSSDASAAHADDEEENLPDRTSRSQPLHPNAVAYGTTPGSSTRRRGARTRQRLNLGPGSRIERVARRLMRRYRHLGDSTSTFAGPEAAENVPSAPRNHVHNSNIHEYSHKDHIEAVRMRSSGESGSDEGEDNAPFSKRKTRRVIESSDTDIEQSDGMMHDSRLHRSPVTAEKHSRRAMPVTARTLRGKLPASFIRVNHLDQWSAAAASTATRVPQPPRRAEVRSMSPSPPLENRSSVFLATALSTSSNPAPILSDAFTDDEAGSVSAQNASAPSPRSPSRVVEEVISVLSSSDMEDNRVEPWRWSGVAVDKIARRRHRASSLVRRSSGKRRREPVASYSTKERPPSLDYRADFGIRLPRSKRARLHTPRPRNDAVFRRHRNQLHAGATANDAGINADMAAEAADFLRAYEEFSRSLQADLATPLVRPPDFLSVAHRQIGRRHAQKQIQSPKLKRTQPSFTLRSRRPQPPQRPENSLNAPKRLNQAQTLPRCNDAYNIPNGASTKRLPNRQLQNSAVDLWNDMDIIEDAVVDPNADTVHSLCVGDDTLAIGRVASLRQLASGIRFSDTSYIGRGCLSSLFSTAAGAAELLPQDGDYTVNFFGTELCFDSATAAQDTLPTCFTVLEDTVGDSLTSSSESQSRLWQCYRLLEFVRRFVRTHSLLAVSDVLAVSDNGDSPSKITYDKFIHAIERLAFRLCTLVDTMDGHVPDSAAIRLLAYTLWHTVDWLIALHYRYPHQEWQTRDDAIYTATRPTIAHLINLLAGLGAASLMTALREAEASGITDNWLLEMWVCVRHYYACEDAEFWRSFNSCMLRRTTKCDASHVSPTAWTLDGATEVGFTQVYELLLAVVQTTAFHSDGMAVPADATTGNWDLVQLLVRKGIQIATTSHGAPRRSMATWTPYALGHLLESTVALVQVYSWVPNIDVLLLWHQHFGSVHFDNTLCANTDLQQGELSASHTTSEALLAQFLTLVDLTLRSQCRALLSPDLAAERTRRLRDLSALVSRLIPTRVFRLCASGSSTTSTVAYEHRQLRNHYRLVISIARATLPTLQDRFAGHMDSFLCYEDSDAKARRICVENFGSLASVYTGLGLQPQDVLQYLCQFLQTERALFAKNELENAGIARVPAMFEQMLQRNPAHNVVKSLVPSKPLQNGDWTTAAEHARWEADVKERMDVIDMLLFQYVTLAEPLERKPQLQVVDVLSLVDEGVHLDTTGNHIPSPNEMDVAQQVERLILAPVHQLVTRGTLSAITPVDDTKEARAVLLRRLVELLALCAHALVQRGTKCWESFLFDFSKYTLTIVSNVAMRYEVNLIFMSRVLVLDPGVSEHYQEQCADIWFRSVGAPSVSYQHWYTNTLASTSLGSTLFGGVSDILWSPLTRDGFAATRKVLIQGVLRQMEIHCILHADQEQARRYARYIKSLLSSLKEYYLMLFNEANLECRQTYTILIRYIVMAVVKHCASFLVDMSSDLFTLPELAFFTSPEFRISFTHRGLAAARLYLARCVIWAMTLNRSAMQSSFAFIFGMMTAAYQSDASDCYAILSLCALRLLAAWMRAVRALYISRGMYGGKLERIQTLMVSVARVVLRINGDHVALSSDAASSPECQHGADRVLLDCARLEIRTLSRSWRLEPQEPLRDFTQTLVQTDGIEIAEFAQIPQARLEAVAQLSHALCVFNSTVESPPVSHPRRLSSLLYDNELSTPRLDENATFRPQSTAQVHTVNPDLLLL
ncbi:hypothetical protein THASP1DRAFT_28056 [Thamnocephalis sphaerospora]|uniref:Mus7/MMS22 family-domain-containing protein n=1 Tax=Thamnocephalis sphaerospora TaxID=78915 RepID=A0A4P9XVT0_9FUNG|nr:hypothetical protein THASP1DRAFT_28056 [Thamnocephalis sphaerospora]|eukprot:RKP10152.1 hypothetical protein THASP1DRAFT_28056 [Thamnocephalis sphaerospora]